MARPETSKTGIYVHIPFCAAICNYCNFNRGLHDEGLRQRYVQALIADIRSYADPSIEADTIFFGGGTPSLLEPPELGAIIQACRDSFSLSPDSEITMEANPESSPAAKLEKFREAGANRLSFGVQSFHDEELRRLGRLHSSQTARDAVGAARAAGFDNLSLDLMMWLPGQRTSDWLATVDGAIALAPDHVSLYLLEVYPNAPLKETMARARWSQAPDDDAAAMYTIAMERLEAVGLRQYEISNVARAGRQSRHNWKYWSDGEWLGFGCGAHSTQDGVRWKNVSATEDYIERISRQASPRVDVRRLSADERLGDALFTGLRLVDGIDLSVIDIRYSVDVWARFGDELQTFVDAGCLRHEGDSLRLTREGMLIAHEVMAVFV